jgi:putative ABC transport system permease protein
MADIFQELRQATRVLGKRPGFTSVAILILALGIGANSAIFSIINGVLLEPLPYPGSGRLTQLWTQFPEDGLLQNPFSPAEFGDYRRESVNFSSMGAYTTGAAVTSEGQPERLQVAIASADLWPTLGVSAALGRTFLPDEDRPGKETVVVLSHQLWQRRFGSSPRVIGQKIVLDDTPYTIVGVMPADFAFPNTDVELWAPLALDPKTFEGRTGHFLEVVGRLRPGASIEQVRAEMQVIADRWRKEYEHAHPMTALPLREQIVGDIRMPLLVLFGTVLLVLLIACANVAGLLVARSQERWREMAIRNALGASRGQLVRQFLMENLVLAVLGGALGLLFAALGLKLLVGLDPGNLPRLHEVTINLRVFAFTLGLSLLTILIFGMVPALRSSRPDPSAALKEGVVGPRPGSTRHRLSGSLVVVEAALATVLLIGAFLLLRSFWKLQHTEPGFATEQMLTARIALPSNRYKEPHQVESFFAELNQRLERIPGARAAAQVDRLPLWQDLVVERFEIEGRATRPGQDTPSTRIQVVDSDFFHTMEIPILQGRAFGTTDTERSPRVVIINETLAKAFFADASPLNQRARILASRPKEVPFTIIGVVADVKDEGLNAPSQPTMYIPHQQAVSYMAGISRGATLLLRTSVPPESLINPLRNTVWSMDKELAISDTQSLDAVISHAVAQPRFTAVLLAVFASVALVLAVVGIYGLMTQLVSQRRREFGIRFSVGATRSDITQLVLSRALLLVGVGLGAGLVLAVGSTRVLASLLYGVNPMDVVSFAGTVLMLAVAALLASYLPAHRASTTDPIVVIRSQ